MYKEELKKILEKFSDFEQLKFYNIPDIDLYMDQVTTFVEEKLGYLKRNEEDSALTKTMINNYTKAGILMPPNKKKYSKHHMVFIILTYYLKQILSINDIQRLFSPIVKSINSGENHDKDLENIYNCFLEIEKNEMDKFIRDLKDKISLDDSEFKNSEDSIGQTSKKINIDKEGINSLIIMVIMLVVKANIEKRMAEKIIDKFFE
ncbi:DUF1836 domain-containing protein [Clostridium tyrobutyricum]|jgi:hypothetical protein|uniref:DUF1836 domain-containing protein n=1 Tax=Clostridium tyrobutyricum DIVETGP TaxID=1408889 RepID=W6N6G1_CLOTY|nr:DUF1836 domain-containing protein [Clostridium tyrobutyricum]AND85893.1 hypothetical protein CTK_C26490 [Clostridium tyrobutyricum]ANP70406.1 hypothetical protein BA182_12205 [Clostridium tyrobutyricum]MBR9648230.1 DUF1836 domain-containing protein [Clostridium tyrobutyricum]MBV4414648.1 DUF1836 domain-containing protein [Clostridium tyrobutyricum]MBV4422605.1 DUF1836 domain-containing protein [Clostridium tyrobutyricum]